MTEQDLEKNKLIRHTEVAVIMGDPELRPRVSNLIMAITELALLFHGIRKGDHASHIAKEGIVPNCPGSSRGLSSFWTGGQSLFHNGTPGKMGTYNTSFFHYAHTSIKNSSAMLLAVTAKDILNENGIRTSPEEIDGSGEITIQKTVPPNLFEMIMIVHEDESLSDLNSRAHAIVLEKKMFEECERIAQHGLSPGTARQFTVGG